MHSTGPQGFEHLEEINGASPERRPAMRGSLALAGLAIGMMVTALIFPPVISVGEDPKPTTDPQTCCDPPSERCTFRSDVAAEGSVELRNLIDELNLAEGEQRVSAMVALLNELVTRHASLGNSLQIGLSSTTYEGLQLTTHESDKEEWSYY
jgi:hypothetical protein